mmetsp:Transcript_105928/g.279638  ORF Transcript_105928/g.279638 Transcript_105928/m.279638 type:complete len:268 (+) Transcript_105928:354-1157(+)
MCSHRHAIHTRSARAHSKNRDASRPPPASRPHRAGRCASVVGAVVLALGVEDPLPVVRLIGLLRVRVHLHLDVAAEEARARLEDRELLLLDHQASEGADDGRARAPVDELTVADLPRRAVQRAHDRVADDVGALAHRSAEVGAQVAHAEELAALRLAHQHVDAAQVDRPQLGRGKVALPEAGLDPREGGQDGLRGVPGRRLRGPPAPRGAGRHERQAAAEQPQGHRHDGACAGGGAHGRAVVGRGAAVAEAGGQRMGSSVAPRARTA